MNCKPFWTFRRKKISLLYYFKMEKNESVLIKLNDKNDFVPVDILAKKFLIF